jgi:RNA polymerase sigma factor (sigma-70 family)
MDGANPIEPADGSQWVAGLIAVEPAAFNQAFGAFHQRVFAFVLRMTKQRELAQDVVQETFLRLAQNATTLQPNTNLRAWLFTVAYRLTVSHIRKMQVRAAMTSDLWMRGHAETPFTGPEQALSSSQTQARIESAFAALPVVYREIALLVAFEEISVQDAAGIIGIKPEAARQRLARARKMIAESLQSSEVP